MNGKLESYIKENRERLDLEIPDDELIWGNIAAQLAVRRKQRSLLWKIAAVILVLVSIGSVSIYLIYKTSRIQPEGISLADISKELAAEEQMFRLAVYQKMNQVSNSGIDPQLSYQLYEELHQIDLQYADYFDDLQDLGEHPKVIRGLIRCYEQKLKILEQTLREIEKSKRHENKRDEV